jgi:hypothetical protein
MAAGADITAVGVGVTATTVGIAGNPAIPLRWAGRFACPPDVFYLVLPNLPLPEDLRTFVFLCATVSEEPA